jgi:hypothetical protein
METGREGEEEIVDAGAFGAFSILLRQLAIS